MEIKTVKPKEKSIGEKKSFKVKKIVICLIVLAIIIGGAYFVLDKLGYIKTLKLAWQIQKQAALSAEDKKIIEQLDKIMLLPQDVTPTMAVITDIDKLKKEQPGFFGDAKNGDRLIIYPTQAIIFDAQANKIIKVGPVQFGQTQANPVNFAVYNGSGDENRVKDIETKLKSAFNNAVVTVSQDASKSDYEKTLVIDLVGNNPEIDKIAEALGAEVSDLPEEETKPEDVVVLVIVGKD